MCLKTTLTEPKIAQEDITCYKVISQNMTSLYYTEFKWELGKLYEAEMECSSQWRRISLISKAFHSYQTLEDLRYGFYKSELPCLMVKCTIPKGSEFYTGIQGSENGFASNKLIINEILDVKDVFKRFDWDNYPFKVGQKIKINKGETIYQILNIQPIPATRHWDFADLIIENCDTSICEVIRTENKKETWVGSTLNGNWMGVGVDIDLKIVE